MTYPKIFLTLDNCFASKRWSKPKDWIAYIHDLGVSYVEASADNECDPLYQTPEFFEDWTKEVLSEGEKAGVSVANLYSGHGTYTTLGLGHYDDRIRKHIRDTWLSGQINTASRLNAGLGFFCHAFAQDVINDPAAYTAAMKNLVSDLAVVASRSREKGLRAAGVEQMYTPHQVPWTIAGARELLRSIYHVNNDPFYLTIDTGHQSGQHKFIRPATEQLIEYATMAQAGLPLPRSTWLGPKAAYDKLANANGHVSSIVESIESLLEDFGHMFSEPKDSDTYAWLSELGCYSPIVHLQQTDGKSSGHRPFTREWNEKGIIEIPRVLESLKDSYDKPADPTLPTPCDEIYLTIEVFSGTADIPYDIHNRLEETVQHIREFIPRDGERLDTLVKNLEGIYA